MTSEIQFFPHLCKILYVHGTGSNASLTFESGNKHSAKTDQLDTLELRQERAQNAQTRDHEDSGYRQEPSAAAMKDDDAQRELCKHKATGFLMIQAAGYDYASLFFQVTQTDRTTIIKEEEIIKSWI